MECCIMENVDLSIICLAYNHEKYIRKTLDGFINQETKYKYEVLINDDASTDHTAEIIREYEKNYPKIIKPIYQVENQYSKKVNLTQMLLNRACGNFFAFCEGDDFWIDKNKIELQVDYLSKHDRCSLCICNAYVVENNNLDYISKIEVCNNSSIIPIKRIIKGGGDFCATNSIMARMKDAKNAPVFLIEFGLDYTWQIYLASCGYTYCFDEYMTVYRSNSTNSWTNRMASDLDKSENVYRKIVKMLYKYDDYTCLKYHRYVKSAILKNDLNIAEIIVKRNDYDYLNKEYIAEWYKFLSPYVKAKLFVWRNFPKLYTMYRYIMGRK